MQDTNDETQNDPTEDPKEAQVRWDCFSCGKHLGEQGDGGSFTLNFGYGSKLDMTRGINGWICDECVTQKHGRLRVSNGAKGLEYWLDQNQIPLAEHEDTKFVLDFDFFGRKQMPGHKYLPREVTGWRDYESIMASERSQVEAALVNNTPLDPDFVVRLLQSLMESEAARHEANSQRYWAEINALSRARQQAKRLSADELAQIRVREAKKKLSALDITQIWEHMEWNETCVREQQDIISEQRKRIEALEVENDALREKSKP
jgi:hypothetical protein